MGVVNLNIESTPYTYILEWTKYNKRYIGARWGKGCHPQDLWKSYFTSSNYVDEFVKEFGPPDIILIDKIFDNADDARKREIFLLTEFDIKNNESFLNKAIGGYFDFNDPAIRKKMKDSHIGNKASPKWVAWVTEFHRTRIRKPETNEKISKALTGKKASEKTRKKISLAKKGVPSVLKGKKLPPEHVEKLREGRLGKLHSEETKQAMGRDRKGKSFKKVVCPHCKKIGGVTGMKRWHFNQCKLFIKDE